MLNKAKTLVYLSAYPSSDPYKQRFFHMLPYYQNYFDNIIIVDAILSFNEKLSGLSKQPKLLFQAQKYSEVDNVITYKVYPTVPSRIGLRIPFLFSFNGFVLKRLLNKIIEPLTPENTVIGTSHPYMYTGFLKGLSEYKIFYECPDMYEEFPWSKRNVSIMLERKLVKAVDYLIASSHFISEVKEMQFGREFEVVTNGVDFELFSKSDKLRLYSNKKVIGYVGALEKWVDLDLIDKIAESFKENEIVIIGAMTDNVIVQINEIKRKYSNISFLGAKPYEEIPSLVKGFDIGIIPFRYSKLIEGVSPIKLYEYLAASLPVVSIYWKELKPFENVAYLSNSDDEFIENIRKGLDEGCNVEREKVASDNSWENKTKETYLTITGHES